MKRATAFLIAILLMLSGTSALAQAVPFQVEVLPQTANMRWCPGNCRIKHFANSGHILTVLEVDDDTDPPWTWYRARTPSGVEAWIRYDLVRQRPDAAPVSQPQQQVSNPTGNYPVQADNFCNTGMFRACQEGTDFQLWEAGYWAKNRYDHWERGGWPLDIVYYLNPCKTQRVCSSREQWDAGMVEAEAAYKASLPTATATPVKAAPGAKATAEPDPIVVTWLGLATDAVGKLPSEWDAASTVNDLFHPPLTEIKDGETVLGKFEFLREKITVICHYWHNAGQSTPSDFIKMRPITVTKFDDDNQVKCLHENSNIDEGEVVGRRWEIKIERTYRGHGRVQSVDWVLSGTYGIVPNDECVDGSGDPAPCVKALIQSVLTYIGEVYDKDKPPTAVPGFITTPDSTASCTGTYHEKDRTPGREVTEYRHRCRYTESDFDLLLEFDFTHDKTRAFLKPPEND